MSLCNGIGRPDLLECGYVEEKNVNHKKEIDTVKPKLLGRAVLFIKGKSYD